MVWTEMFGEARIVTVTEICDNEYYVLCITFYEAILIRHSDIN